MTYSYSCRACGEHEIERSIKDHIPKQIYCYEHGLFCDRRFTPPYFQEDRLRFFKGRDGSKYSYALGQQMPDSRQERDRIAKEKGVEFFSGPANKTEQAIVEYNQHIKAGATHEEADKAAPIPEFSTKGKFVKKVKDYLDKGGFREKIVINGNV